MSGHSKWHNIQARKGKQDSIRSNLFSKYAKAIMVTAKHGGNPDANFSLRIAIDKAKAIGMPKDNIDRAIKRGSGEGADAVQIDEVMYEAYGPGGSAIIIKALTDNKNRTVSDIKHILSERGGSMGGSGSVLWMFEQWGVIEIEKEKIKSKNLSDDDFQMILIEAGAEDIWEEDDLVKIKTKVENFQKVLNKLKEMELESVSSGLQWIAKDKMPATDDIKEKLSKLFDELEENDDVEDYFTNVE